MTSNEPCASSLTATSNTITVTTSSVIPAVTITSPTNSICSGGSITFTAVPTNGGTTPGYLWQVNGATVSGQTASTFTTSTLNNGDVVTVVMTSNEPCASPLTATSNPITITTSSVIPAVTITSPTNSICSGGSITFTAVPTNGGTTPGYLWQVNGATVPGQTASTFTTSTLNNGDVVTAVMTSNEPCASPLTATSNTITITTSSVIPVVTITSPTTSICSGGSITFTAAPTNGGTAPTYQWKVNTLNAGTNSPTFTTGILNNGDVVTVVMTSNEPCASLSTATSNIITITAINKITPTFVAIGPLCQSSSVPNLPAISTNTPTITGTWSPASISASALGATTYTFTPDPGQCAVTTTMSITIVTQITPTFAAIGPLLLNTAIPVLPSFSTNTPSITGTWLPNVINTAVAGNTNYIFTPDPGQCAGSATMVITIDVKAVIAEEETIPGANAIIAGSCQQVKLNASKSVGDNLIYDWSSLDQGGALTGKTGMSTEFLLSPSFTGTLPAIFRVRLTVTDKMGNSNSDTVRISVDRLPVADIVSSGKLDKDGSMLVNAVVTVGTATNYTWSTTQGQIIGPNNLPTASLLGAGIYTLQITDTYGCQVAKDFTFPIELYQIIANPDYARTSWSRDTTIHVLQNDHSNVALIPGSVKILTQPAMGTTKINPDGSITYIPNQRHSGHDEFEYEVCDAVNLCASAKVIVDIYDSEIIIPEGFSPDGDGSNDILVFKGLDNYLQSQLYVFTRSGILVYQSDNYQNNWDGIKVTNTLTTLERVPTGVYYYVLKLGGTNRTLKGFIYVGY